MKCVVKHFEKKTCHIEDCCYDDYVFPQIDDIKVDQRTRVVNCHNNEEHQYHFNNDDYFKYNVASKRWTMSTFFVDVIWTGSAHLVMKWNVLAQNKFP